MAVLPRMTLCGNFVYIVRCIYDWCGRPPEWVEPVVSVCRRQVFDPFETKICNQFECQAQRRFNMKKLKQKQQLGKLCIGFNKLHQTRELFGLEYFAEHSMESKLMWSKHLMSFERKMGVRRMDGHSECLPKPLQSSVRNFHIYLSSNEGSDVFVTKLANIKLPTDFHPILFLTSSFRRFVGSSVSSARPSIFPISSTRLNSNENIADKTTTHSTKIIIIRLNRDGIRWAALPSSTHIQTN